MPDEPPREDRVADPPAAAPPGAGPAKTAAERWRRQAQRVRLYGSVAVLVVLLVVLVALAVANRRQVRLSWVVGDTDASLVWIIVTSFVLGWLVGMTTSVILRLRARRRRAR